jgi:two-component system, chemotaxis family, chemotaxis protein CheY
MNNLDNELAQEYLAEGSEHLAALETDLLTIEQGGTEIDEEVISRAFQSVHSVKQGAGFLALVKIHELARQTEDVLAQIRSRKMAPTPGRVTVLLRAIDRLRELIQNPGTSNQADITEIKAALSGLGADNGASAGTGNQAHQCRRHLRMLLVEDDFTSRLLLQTFLSRYGECHVAVNGREAVEAFRSALEQGQRYDLICMDIMMPEMDGREAVRQVRLLEEARGILSSSRVKIIMTTAVDDIKEAMRCFKEICDEYLTKPIDLAKLLSHMKFYQLVQ